MAVEAKGVVGRIWYGDPLRVLDKSIPNKRITGVVVGYNYETDEHSYHSIGDAHNARVDTTTLERLSPREVERHYEETHLNGKSYSSVVRGSSRPFVSVEKGYQERGAVKGFRIKKKVLPNENKSAKLDKEVGGWFGLPPSQWKRKDEV